MTGAICVGGGGDREVPCGCVRRDWGNVGYRNDLDAGEDA